MRVNCRTDYQDHLDTALTMTQPLPLQDVKVLDLTQIMAGPYCTMMLADMGADVTKVEKPNGGDDTRRMGPPFIEGESAAFLGINRNKRSIVVDMKSERGFEIVRRMACESDILVQNFRPGALERMGLDYENVKIINPAIVYCTISGFGLTGPYSRRGGFDLVAQGMSGLMSVNGPEGGPPTKVGVPICDLNAGMFAAIGILTAYVHRLRTGRGQHVDTSLLEGGIAYTFWESMMYFATGGVPGPMGSTHRLTAPYQPFETADGYVNVGAANQANWERLCAAIGRDELVTDPRFVQPKDRMNNLDELAATLEETFRRETSAHWLEKLERAGVPSARSTTSSRCTKTHRCEPGTCSSNEHPVAGRLGNIGIPIKLSDTPGSFRRPAPTLGQHTNEVLHKLGYADREIHSLRSEGAVK